MRVCKRLGQGVGSTHSGRPRRRASRGFQYRGLQGLPTRGGRRWSWSWLWGWAVRSAPLVVVGRAGPRWPDSHSTPRRSAALPRAGRGLEPRRAGLCRLCRHRRAARAPGWRPGWRWRAAAEGWGGAGACYLEVHAAHRVVALRPAPRPHAAQRARLGGGGGDVTNAAPSPSSPRAFNIRPRRARSSRCSRCCTALAALGGPWLAVRDGRWTASRDIMIAPRH